MSRLRLLKVVVQPIFVVDDGETLIEQPAAPITVTPAEWPTYATTTFVASMEQAQREFDAAGTLTGDAETGA